MVIDVSLAPDSEDTIERRFSYAWASGLTIPVMSVVLAVIVGGVVILVAGNNPLTAYWELLKGAFGGPYNISETLVASIPLMLTGLAVAFAFRGGLFNIGAEGQLFMGAIASAFVGYKLNLPGIILIPIALVAGALSGAIWGGIAGVLKAWRGAHEVITTMMLNYTAILISQYLLEASPTGTPGPMSVANTLGSPQTPVMNATLPVIIPNSMVQNGRLHAGLLVALAAAVFFWFVLWRTSLGYKIRAVGLNPKAAAYAGINVGWTIALSMFIAGAFAGLGGMVSVFGVSPYAMTNSFSPGYGFDAIAVALLGKTTAAGTILAAILFGALVHGSTLMQADAGISSHLVEILQGLIIFFIGADAIVRALGRRGITRLPRYMQREGAAA
jgi:general nucleoside transport system permease protein